MGKQVGERGLCMCVGTVSFVSHRPSSQTVRSPLSAPGPPSPGFSPWPVDPVGGVASAVLLSPAPKAKARGAPGITLAPQDSKRLSGICAS